MCHRTFGSPTAGERHRVANDPVLIHDLDGTPLIDTVRPAAAIPRRCATAAELEHRGLVLVDGVYRGKGDPRWT